MKNGRAGELCMSAYYFIYSIKHCCKNINCSKLQVLIMLLLRLYFDFTNSTVCFVRTTVVAVFSFLSFDSEKATEAQCRRRIQTCLGVTFVSEFSA